LSAHALACASSTADALAQPLKSQTKRKKTFFVLFVLFVLFDLFEEVEGEDLVKVAAFIPVKTCVPAIIVVWIADAP
jgi:hypothetical protein